jgi:MinD superfamily P-loop ATPase
VLATTAHFGVRALVCINKADLSPAGTAEIESFCQEQSLEIVGQIPFDLSVTESMVKGETVTAFAPEAPASLALKKIWAQVLDHVNGGRP